MIVAALALLLCASAQAKVAESKTLKGVFIDDRGRPEERRLIEETLKRIQAAPAVRAMEPRRRALPPVTVSFAAIATSSEPYKAGRAECDFPVPRVLFGEVLLDKPDYLAETAAHEIYGHCVILREARALGVDMSKTLENEAFSFAIGVVTALEVGGTLETDARVVPLTISTNIYAAQVLCTDSPEHLSLTVEELADPHGAVKARRRELARRRVSTRISRKWTKLWRWRVEHFVKVHGANPEAFSGLSAALDLDDAVYHPEQTRQLDIAEPDMRLLDEYMATEEGVKFVAQIASVSTSPFLWKLHQDWGALQRRFARLVEDLPSADPPAASTAPATAQIGWDELNAMSAKDIAENIAHWDGSPEASAAPEWRVPWPRGAPEGTTTSRVLPEVYIDDRGRPEEGVWIDGALALLQTSAIVRALEPRRRERGRFTVGFAALDSSTRPFSGAHGNTDIKRDPVRVNLNESLLVSTRAFVQTLAHELYGHGITLREADELDLDLGHLVHGEEHALAVGLLAALETGSSTAEDARMDALARGTTAYEAEILFEDAKERYLSLGRAEARDARAAIAARQRELARRRKSVTLRRQESLIWRWRMEHFTKVHRVDPATFADMRASVDQTLDGVLPEQRATLDAADPYLKEVETWLKTKDGRAFSRSMTAASTSAYLRELESEIKAYARYIAALRAAAPAPAAEAAAESAPPGPAQTDWAGLDAMCDKDRAEHPEHWVGERVVMEKAPPWLAP